MIISTNFALEHLNTFHLPVFTSFFTEVSTIEEVHTLLDQKSLVDLSWLVLGGGSNILFTKNFEGLVIKNNFTGMVKIDEDANHYYVRAGAGEVWHNFVSYCIENSYAGIENLSLIPGSVGAGPIQNIGAYGTELKDIFHELTAVDLKDGSLKKFGVLDCNFDYRNSVFKNKYKNSLLITDVTFRLNKHPVFNTRYGAIEQELERMQVKEKNIRVISEAVCNIRRSKLPDPEILGNCGSFFKNPEIEKDDFISLKVKHPAIIGYPVDGEKVKVAAGWLIEQCGWKGKRYGNTGSHKDQALVLVNYGGATGAEIVSLASQIQESVKEKFGIEIEAEVNII